MLGYPEAGEVLGLLLMSLHALLLQGTTVCAVMPMNRAVSSKGLCAHSWACSANGR